MNGMLKRLLLLAVLVGATACASSRQYIKLADETYSTAVFAVDDAREAACVPTPTIGQDRCRALRIATRKALVDVKALSEAIKAMPKDGKVPRSLPDLLKDLHDAQEIVVAGSPAAPELANPIANAINEAIGLLNRIAGGN